MMKHSLSRIRKVLTALLACATLICGTFAITNWQSSTANAAPVLQTQKSRTQNGLTFAKDLVYEMEEALPSLPRTFEAYVNLPKSYKARAGVIVGNYDAYTAKSAVVFELQYDSTNDVAFPKLYYDVQADTNVSPYTIEFKNVDVRSDEYVHIVITHDAVNDVAYCYFNGELKQTVQTTEPEVYNNMNYTCDEIFRIGGDGRKNNEQWFKGSIKGVELYSDVRSAEEVASDYERLLTAAPTGDNLLAAYNFTAESGFLTDLSSNGNDLYLSRGALFVTGAEDIYNTAKVVTGVPKTFEAYLSTSATARAGCIYSTYKDNKTLGFSFELQYSGSNLCPRLFFVYGTDKTKDVTFKNVQLKAGNYVHVALVREGDNITCYVNGVSKQTISVAGINFDYNAALAPRVGGDHRGGNGQWLKSGTSIGDSSVASIEVYSDARTAAEVKADFARKSQNTPADKDLVAAYDFTAPIWKCFNDNAGNGNHIVYSKQEPDYKAADLEGIDANTEDVYALTTPLTKLPKTFEAMVLLPKHYSARAGVLLGNYNHPAKTGEYRYSFEIYTNGNPRIYYDYDGESGVTNNAYVFKTVDIRSDEFVHLAITHDVVTNKVYCYVNGELKEEGQLPVNKEVFGDYSFLSKTAPVVGNDHRLNAQWFKGVIAGMEIYSDLRTAEEIALDAQRACKEFISDSNLLAAFDFTQKEPLNLLDKSSNGNDVLFNGDIDYSGLEGATFNSDDRYYTVNKLNQEAPNTFEAEVFLPKSYTARAGIIYGNWGSGASINFEINPNGKVRFYHTDTNGIDQNLIFENSNIRTGDWAHVAVVHDKAANATLCYINGELVGSLAYYEYNENAANAFFNVGGDNRSANEQYFKGWIRSVSIYSDARSASEIASDYKNGTDVTADNLLVHYDLTDGLADSVKDLSGNGNDLARNRSWFTEKEAVTDYAYSFAVVGDTQIICEKDPANMATIYDWILANKDSKNIKHVFGLGDITNGNTDKEWIVAQEAISKMDGVIPYSLVRGNHDSTAKFNTYFGYDAYKNQFGGFKTNNVLTDSWMAFTVGETDYLLITLDYGASDETLAWAGSVIEAHPNHKVIITTHAYMYRDGTTLDQGDVCPPATTGGFNNGDHMWDKLISKYGNIFLVMSGHDPCDNVVTRQTKGVHGNTVTQMLIDPQGMDAAIGSTGMVAMLYFSEDGSKIDVEFYSTIKNQYYKDSNQYVIPVYDDLESAHTFDKMVESDAYLASEATCTAPKAYYYSCECGAKSKKTFTVGEALGHTFDQKVVSEKYLVTKESCTQKGVYHYSCHCGEIGEQTFEVEMLSHTFGNWKKYTEPTCEQAGHVGYYECSVCLGKYDADYNKIEDVSIPATGHSYSEELSFDENGHWHECTVCSAHDSDPIAHVYGEWEIVKENTVKEDGLKVKRCECGHTVEEVIPFIDETVGLIQIGGGCASSVTGGTFGLLSVLAVAVIVKKRRK